MENSKMKIETKYTPATIAASQTTFSIPLYQRLFEWEKPQITQLLNDLYGAFMQNPSEPYYIGMLTAHNKDLVDGQQRFTVLMLMAISFKWNSFLKVDNGSDKTDNAVDIIRLSFFAREKDRTYLLKMINNETEIPTDYKNAKMELGIKCIADFVNTLEIKQEFIDYVFNHLTFFISELPTEYKPQDLNKYFEAMNADGRGLENHEILKVDLLKQLARDKEFYTRIWNVIADMDKLLIRPKYENRVQEDTRKLNERQRQALQNITNSPNSFTYCNDSTKSTESLSEFQTIREISAKNEAPKTNIRSIGERAILNFPEFLLQVLWLQLSEEERNKTTNFFNVHKLQDTFKANLQAEKVELFFQNLLKFRLLFDYFIVRISNNDNNTTNYTLAFKEEAEDKDNWRSKLIQYQSMLYVSTSSNNWLTKILQEIAENSSDVTLESMYRQLVDFDNARRRELDADSLSYGKIDRYWFWRLDYYLWERRSEFFKEKKQLEAVEKYTFKQNRSIEHLHPQTSNEPWADVDLHCFGNLAMISPEFNSTQSNDDIKLKFARVETQIEGKNNLESIKMLLMFIKGDVKSWTSALAKEHEIEMIKILSDSFTCK